MLTQDPTDPTGVSGEGDTIDRKAVARARVRKANAALGMKLAGANWVEIAHALGYPTARTAQVAVERSLERNMKAEDRTYLRRLAGARLERLLATVWPKAIDPYHQEQLIASTKARELINDYRKLFGLDAPTEVIVHQPTRVELEEWVAKVVAMQSVPVDEDDILDVEWEEDPPALEASG